MTADPSETMAARCGHPVPAVGKPGSLLRRSVQARPCPSPRCQSGLPRRFTDAECQAYQWLHDIGIREWMVDLLTREVLDYRGKRRPGAGPNRYPTLVAFARSQGWSPTT